MEKKFSVYDSLKFGVMAFFQNFVYFLKLFLILIPYMILSNGLLFLIIFSPFITILYKMNMQENMAVAKGLMGLPEGINPMINFFSENLLSSGLSWLLGIAFVLFIFFMILNGTFIHLGFSKILLNIVDGKKNTVSTLFSQRKLIGRGFLASMLIFSSFMLFLLIAASVFFFLRIFFLQSFSWSGSLSHASFFSMAALLLFVFVFILLPGSLFFAVYGFYYFALVDENIGVIESFKQSKEITRGVRLKLFIFNIITSIIGFVVANIFGLLWYFVTPMISMAFVYVYRTLKKQTNVEQLELSR